MAEQRSKKSKTEPAAGDSTDEAAATQTDTVQPDEVPAEQPGPAAAPLDPPNAAVHPEGAHPDSSTNPVAASAAVQTMPGDAHIRIVTPNPAYEPGEEGSEEYVPVEPENMFNDPGGHATYVEAASRLFEEFRHHGAVRVDRRLLYAPGTHVTRARATDLQRVAGAGQTG